MLNAGDMKALQLIAAVGRVDLEDPRLSAEQRAALRPQLDRLFDLGVININPPGWAFVVNATGHAALAGTASGAPVAPVAPAAPALTEKAA